MSLGNIWWKKISGRKKKNSEYKGPEIEMGLLCLRTLIWLGQRVRGTTIKDEMRDTVRPKVKRHLGN
jgi:hypothetical protein